MSTQQFWSVEHSAGTVLILGFVALFVGASMFWIRGGIRGGAPPSHVYFVWERSFIIAAVILTAVGFTLLDVHLQNTDGRVLAIIGATVYLFGGVLLVAAETLSLTQGFEKYYPLIIIYVILAFLAEASIGGALLQAGLMAVWIGWLTVLWNIGWLIVLSLISPRNLYIPFLHHLMPCVIGIALLLATP